MDKVLHREGTTWVKTNVLQNRSVYENKYFKYFWFIVTLGLFVFLMFSVRIKTKTDIRNRIYQQWERHFVVKDGNEAYIKTTNDKDKDIVLSESQSYGMLITVRAAQKGLASQQDFERLYKYYLISSY